MQALLSGTCSTPERTNHLLPTAVDAPVDSVIARGYPCAGGCGAARDAKPPRHTRSMTKPVMMIAEADAALRRELGRLLRAEGVDVIDVSDDRDILRTPRQVLPDLVIVG